MSQVAVKVKWGMAAMLSILSTTLVNELRLAGFPDLIDGQILFGWENLKARRAPPSIVAVWVPGTAAGAEPLDDAPWGAPVQPVLNALATEHLRLDFYCWASANPSDPLSSDDADACRYLYTQLWRVIHRGAQGAYRILSIDPSTKPPSADGYQAVLRVEFATPVVDTLIAYIQPGAKGAIGVTPAGAPASDEINIETGVLT